MSVTLKLFSKILDDKIVVACVTCNTVFLNMKWREYLPILNGDFHTPTKWYNEVVLHYCQNITHTILSNRDQQGFNKQFNFSDFLMQECEDNHVSTTDLAQIALEMETKLERMPI